MGLRGMFGGGASVDAVLGDNRVHPGGQLQGVVNVQGGKTALNINGIELALQARVRYQTDDGTTYRDVEFGKNVVCGAFQLSPGATQQLQFQFQVPWETPFTTAAGTPFPDVRVGLVTTLDIAKAVDKGDVDPLAVHALPSHEAILMGAARIGFELRKVEVDGGRTPGAALPFHQELEFKASEEFRRKVRDIEFQFVTDERGLTVFLVVDKKGFRRDAHNSFFVDHAMAATQDWAGLLYGHVKEVVGD